MNEVIWLEKDGNQVLPIWITAGALRKISVEGRFWGDLLSSYCTARIPNDANLPIVAKRGGRGDDFAVYIGLPKTELISPMVEKFYHQLANHAGVVRHGFKINEKLARELFPRLSDFVYRS